MTLCILPSGERYVKPDFFAFYEPPNLYHFNGISIRIGSQTDKYIRNAYCWKRYYAFRGDLGVGISNNNIVFVKDGKEFASFVFYYSPPQTEQQQAGEQVIPHPPSLVGNVWAEIRSVWAEIRNVANMSILNHFIGDKPSNPIEFWEWQSYQTYEVAKEQMQKHLEIDVVRDDVTVQVADQQWLAYSTVRSIVVIGRNDSAPPKKITDQALGQATTVRVAPLTNGWAVEIDFRTRFLLFYDSNLVSPQYKAFPTTPWERISEWVLWRATGDVVTPDGIFIANAIDKYITQVKENAASALIGTKGKALLIVSPQGEKFKITPTSKTSPSFFLIDKKTLGL